MEPRPLLELNVRQAISRILQKPRWWVKIRDPEIRKKWMGEVKQQLLLESFEQSLMNWRHGHEPLDNLRDLLRTPDGPEKKAKLRQWLKGIIIDFCLYTKSDKKSKDTLQMKVKSQHAYPSVNWVLNQLMLHERLSAIPIEEWSEQTIGGAVSTARVVDDPELPSRAAEFVLAVERGVRVEDALRIPVGSNLLSTERLLMPKRHCKEICRELEAVQKFIIKFIQLIADSEGASTEW